MTCVVETMKRSVYGIGQIGANTFGVAFAVVGRMGGWVIAQVSLLIKDSGGLKNISLLTSSILEGLDKYGATSGQFAKLAVSCKAFNEFVTAGKIITTVNEFTSGKAAGDRSAENYPKVALLASNISFLVYDFFGTLKFAEKAELVSQGVGNGIAAFARTDAEGIRSFFGFMGCGFGLVDLGLTWRESGFSKALFFKAAINATRLVGFWAIRGSWIGIGTTAVTAALGIAQSIITRPATPPSPPPAATAA